MTMYLDHLARRVKAELDPDVLPDDQGLDDLLRIYALLIRAKGAEATAEDVHDAWAVWMAGRDPEHEALVPYEQLPADKRAQDAPFLGAVRAVARSVKR